MKEKEPTAYLDLFINQTRLDVVVSWHNRQMKLKTVPEFMNWDVKREE